MHIGIITPGFSASEQDWCIPAHRDLVVGLAKRQQVTVLSLRYPSTRTRYEISGAQVIPVGAGQCRGPRRALMMTRALLSLTAQHRRDPFCIFHAMWAHESGWLAIVAARFLRVPTVVSLLGGELAGLPAIDYGGQLSLVNRVLTRSALRQCDAITVGSKFQWQHAAEHGYARKLHRLPLGVATDRFTVDSPAPTPLSGSPRLLQVGSLVPVKDHATSLRAFASCRNRLPAAHLHIVGDGPLRDDLTALADQLELGSAVVFHGEVEHHLLPGFYRQADLLLQSSVWEGQAMVVLEAAACAVPTVGSAVGVLPELLGSSRSVEPGDTEALADAMTSVLSDADSRESMGQAAWNYAQGDYSLTQCIAGHVDLYKSLIKSIGTK